MAMKLLPIVVELPVDNIQIGERARPFSEPEVAALVDLIEEFGQTTPILVRRTKAGFVLVDGLHRLEATKRSGLAKIPVRAYEMTDIEARMLEASQNLVGGLSPLDDAVFLAVWKKAHLEKYPETAPGVAGALARHGLQGNSSSFAEIVATKRAISVRQVRKIIAAGDRLGRNDLTLLRSSPNAITLKDLEAIGKIGDDGQRARIVARMASGEAKSVKDAWRHIAAEDSGEKAPVKDPVEAAFNALSKAWERAPMVARRRFLAGCPEIALMLGGEDGDAE
jgi:ParB family transcriptional regulator, chromosome partitioning protein